MRYAVKQDFRELIVPLPVGETCSCSSAVHDLAALSEGNLSREGKRRLASHLVRCQSCKQVLVLLADEAPAAGSTGNRRLESWLDDVSRLDRALDTSGTTVVDGQAVSICARTSTRPTTTTSTSSCAGLPASSI